jgi:surface antigen
MPARRARVCLAAAFVLALASGGCSFQLGSMFEQGQVDTKVRHTGTVTASEAAPTQVAAGAELDAALRAAASTLFSSAEPNGSIPWENPQTGARGTVTSIADAYVQAGTTCRDFLASYIQANSENWLQGEACREQQGQWEVRSLKPWIRS